MHYLQNGQWQESHELIQSVPGGAVALNGQHRVSFANDLATPGAIDMLTPEGKELRSHILGLSYFDAASGSNVLIAQVTNCQGVIVQPNQLLYRNAFTEFKADVLYTYTKGGFEQDVILRERPPLPEDYGMDSRTTHLQIITEFLSPPTPLVNDSMIDAGVGNGQRLLDESLDFGAMKIGRGKAFILGGGANVPGSEIPMAKQWLLLEGRRILVEEVAVPAVANQLGMLPAPGQASIGTVKDSVRHLVSTQRRIPEPRQTPRKDNRKMEMAGTFKPQEGFVLDYLILNSSLTNYAFAGDTTYYVSGNVNLYGTNTLEGGAVIKFTNSINAGAFPATGASITIFNTSSNSVLNCLTSPYHPAIFTAKDDDTVGTTIPGSTGTPVGYYGGVGLLYQDNLNSSQLNTHDVRMCYLGTGIYFSGSQGRMVSDAQFVNCADALCVSTTSGTTLRNVLVTGGTNAILNGGDTIVCANVTCHNVQNFYQTNGYAAYMTNCLFAGCSTNGIAIAGANNQFLANDTGVFQTIGGGANYLAANSPYRGAGTTNIHPVLLLDLQKKTTYPPMVLTNAIATDTVLLPIVQKNTGTPDIGYHYDPLDYLISCIITNATLTVLNGTAIGYSFSDWGYSGFGMREGSQFISSGLANNRNYIVSYKMAQEQPSSFWTTATAAYATGQSLPINTYHTNFNRNPALNFRFTTLAPPNGANYALYSGGGSFEMTNISLRDCEIFTAGSAIAIYGGGAYSFQDSLFVYPNFTLQVDGFVTNYNNLYTGNNDWLSYAYFGNNSSAVLTSHDNVFDRCESYMDGAIGYNAYLNNGLIDNVVQTNDVVVTNFTWLAGPLGNYYQPANSPLLNLGSRPADLAGLFHYTTTVNQLKETNSVVDIGYHYVALNGNGNPIDTNGDGIPDYLADINGNGIFDAGDLWDWKQTNADTNGLISLQVYTPLK